MTDYFKRQLSQFSACMQSFFQIKYWVFLGMMWVITSNITKNVVVFSEMTSEKTTPTIYAFIQSSPMFFIFYLLGVLCLFSDVPFDRRDQLYVLLREGRKKWYWHQIFYLFLCSSAAILTAALICLLQLHSCLKFSTQWDKILGTLAYTDAGTICKIPFAVPSRILSHYSPLETFIYSLLIGLGVTFFLGVFLFAVSLCTSRKISMITASAMVLMCSLHDYYPAWMRYTSPVSWIRTTSLGMVYMDNAPRLTYVLIMLPATIIVCVIAGYFMILKKDLDWTEEH